MDGAVTVSGRIHLGADDHQVAVVDLKSTHRAQAEALTETQLRLYALGYEALTGQWPARTEIWELDAPTDPRGGWSIAGYLMRSRRRCGLWRTRSVTRLPG